MFRSVYLTFLLLIPVSIFVHMSARLFVSSVTNQEFLLRGENDCTCTLAPVTVSFFDLPTCLFLFLCFLMPTSPLECYNQDFFLIGENYCTSRAQVFGVDRGFYSCFAFFFSTDVDFQAGV